LSLDIRRSEISRRRREAVYESTQTLDATSWAEVAPQLDEALAALDDEPREMLVRHFLRGESQADLAAELGTSPATLSRRMKQAVETLREELSRRGVSVAPLVLFNLLAHNGPAAATVSLNVAMGKLSLYCAAKCGIKRFSWKQTLTSLPQSIYSLRWAIAAAMFSFLVCTLMGMGLRQVQLHSVTTNTVNPPVETVARADSFLSHR
jgi:hypothetical protein